MIEADRLSIVVVYERIQRVSRDLIHEKLSEAQIVDLPGEGPLIVDFTGYPGIKQLQFTNRRVKVVISSKKAEGDLPFAELVSLLCKAMDAVADSKVVAWGLNFFGYINLGKVLDIKGPSEAILAELFPGFKSDLTSKLNGQIKGVAPNFKYTVSSADAPDGHSYYKISLNPKGDSSEVVIHMNSHYEQEDLPLSELVGILRSEYKYYSDLAIQLIGECGQ